MSKNIILWFFLGLVYVVLAFMASAASGHLPSPPQQRHQAEWHAIPAPYPAKTNKKPKITTSRSWALDSIGFNEVVRSGYGLKCDVVVGVVDTGLDYNHDAIKTSLWRNPGEIPGNGIDDDRNGFIDDVIGWDFVSAAPQPEDNHGHGTHIAGLIAGYGTGACPGARIMALKYYDNSGPGYNNLQNTINGIEYATSNAADVINYSGGGPDASTAEINAIRRAGTAAIVFVTAAGNDGRNINAIPYYPASYGLANEIVVASLNPNGELLPSSNFGQGVDVAAPGVLVVSSLPGAKGDAYGTMSGTSQATALVSGVAAALAGEMRARGLKPDASKIKAWITLSATPLRDKAAVRYGAVSLKKALALAIAELDGRKK
jgi:major intracellular serine protease